MANPFTQTVGPIAPANAANIVASNTPAGAGNLALVGGGPVVLDVPRQVLVTFGIEVAARIIKISGTNRQGLAISETLTIPSGGAATKGTVQQFLTITQVQVFAAWSVAMSVGTSNFASSEWFLIDHLRIPVQIAAVANIIVAGSYQIEATMDDPNAGYILPNNLNVPSSDQPQSNIPPLIFNEPGFGAAKATAFQYTINSPWYAIRLTLTTAGTAVQAQFIQAGAFGA